MFNGIFSFIFGRHMFFSQHKCMCLYLFWYNILKTGGQPVQSRKSTAFSVFFETMHNLCIHFIISVFLNEILAHCRLIVQHFLTIAK